jgi:hypothetical protein
LVDPGVTRRGDQLAAPPLRVSLIALATKGWRHLEQAPGGYLNRIHAKRDPLQKRTPDTKLKHSSLQLRADEYKAIGPGSVDGRTIQPLCCGIVKGDPIDRICSIVTDATSECDGAIKYIPFCTWSK